MTTTEPTDAELKAEARKGLPGPRTVLALVVAPIYAIALGGLVLLTLAWPVWDRFNWPVLTDQSVSQVAFQPGARKLCWTWAFTKTQDAKATFVGFQVQDRDGDVASIFPYRADTGSMFDARAPSRKPGRHSVPLCADLPDGIESPWVVTGHIDYETGRWWRVRADSPPIATDGRSTEGSNG